MTENGGLQRRHAADRLPGFRALGRFWAAVGLILGTGAAVLGYLGPPEAARSEILDANAALTANHAVVSNEAASGEPSLAGFAMAAASSPSPLQPAPAPDNSPPVSGKLSGASR